MGKVLGVFIFGLVVVFSIMFFWNRQNGGKSDTPATQQPENTESTETTSPTPTQVKVLVYAAGTQAEEEYPIMDLYINGTKVHTWSDIKGDPANGKFEEFEYFHPQEITNQEIALAFTNDLFISDEEDRNLYIDRVIVGDRIFVADSPSTETILDNSQEQSCVDGNTYSRWLRCNGQLVFNKFEVPPPLNTAAGTRLVQGSVLRIYAAGEPGGGVYPTMDLLIKGQKVATFANVAGNPTQRILMEYSLTIPGTLSASDVSLVFVNDYYKNDLDDRNLYVDRINLNGTDYFSNDSSVYQTGVWSGGGCTQGYLRQKMLRCPKASLKFAAR